MDGGACRGELRRLRRDQVLMREWPLAGVAPELFYLVDAAVPLTFAPDGRCYEQDELALGPPPPLPPARRFCPLALTPRPLIA